MPQLIVAEPGLPVRTLELKPGPNLLGRAHDNAIVIANESLSRRHACLLVTPGRALLNDLGSKNGTFVAGERVIEVELRDGTRFMCGAVELEFRGQDRERSELLHEINLSQRQPDIDDFLQVTGPRRQLDTGERQERMQRGRDLVGVIESLATLSPNDAFENILELLLGTMESVDYAALLLCSAATAEVELKAARSRTGSSNLNYSRHVVDYARERATAVSFSGGTSVDQRFSGADSIIDQHINASMCVPLTLRDHGTAFIYVDARTSHHTFSSEDLEFLCVFGRYAAVKLDNAALVKKLEEEAVLRSHLLRFFPSNTALQLLATEGGMFKPVKLQATTLFCDLCEFTALSSTEDPAVVIALLNEYFQMLASIVFRHGGTLEKYIGDAVLAVWGAPFRAEDDADRAVLAAIEMQRSFLTLARAWQRAGSASLGIHIGMDTGIVAAGNIGSDRYLQYATIGEPTTLASRICGEAKFGEILISNNTHSALLSAHELRAEPVAPLQVKGRAQPLQAWRVAW